MTKGFGTLTAWHVARAVVNHVKAVQSGCDRVDCVPQDLKC